MCPVPTRYFSMPGGEIKAASPRTEAARRGPTPTTSKASNTFERGKFAAAAVACREDACPSVACLWLPPLRRSRAPRVPNPTFRHRSLCRVSQPRLAIASSTLFPDRLSTSSPRSPRALSTPLGSSLHCASFSKATVQARHRHHQNCSRHSTPHYSCLHIALTPLPVWVHPHFNACPAVRLLLQSIGCHSPDLPPRGWGREVWRMAPVTPPH